MDETKAILKACDMTFEHFGDILLAKEAAFVAINYFLDLTGEGKDGKSV